MMGLIRALVLEKVTHKADERNFFGVTGYLIF